MPHDKIINYYLLCKIRDRTLPVINSITDDNFDILFTKKQAMLYLRERDGVYIIKEFIIGGDDDIEIKGGQVLVY